MKKIKKASLKIFSKNNVKNLIYISLIKILINLTLLFLTFLTVYSLSNYTISENNIFYSTLYPISQIKNLSFGLLQPILILILFYTFFLSIPLKAGIYLWFSEIKKDDKTSLLIIFHYYKNSKLLIKSILFKLALLFKSALNFALCFLPTVGTFIFCCLRLPHFPQELQLFLRILILVAAATILIAAFFFLKLQISQIPAKFLFVQNSSENFFTIIKSSDFLVRNNNKDFKKLLRFFAKYISLCFLIMPIPFITAYFRMCLFEFTKKIVYKQNQGISAIPLTQKVININL